MACGRFDHRIGFDTNYYGDRKHHPRSVGTGGKPDQGYGLVRLLRREDGWVIIEALIAIPLLIFILFAAVEYWGVLTVYRNAENVKQYMLSRMEIEGGLTESDETILRDKLVGIGADPDSIRIEGTVLGEGRDPVLWPNEVNLRIEFVPRYFNNFAARTIIGGSPGKPVRIGVEGSAVSQKIQE